MTDPVQQMLAYHFMVNALRAGVAVAVVAGAVGWFMVLRRQAFAGHTLAVVGFPGASGAAWAGLPLAVGYLGFCVAAALVIAAFPAGRAGAGPDPARGDGGGSAVVGTLQALALASGFLFVSLSKGFLGTLTSLLFGSITGVNDTQVAILAVAGAAVLAVLAVLGRPLFFASVDGDVAAARGVPVRLLDAVFLVLLGVAAAAAAQVVGALLVFALLVTPAATAAALTARPGAALALSVAVAVAVTLAGETIAFFSPYPIGFWVTSLAFAAYVLATGYRALADRASVRSGGRRATAERQVALS